MFWQVSALFKGQSSRPLPFGNFCFYSDVKDTTLPRSQLTAERWFNTAANFERDPRKQPGSNLRTFPLRLSDVRDDGSTFGTSR